MRSNRTRSTWTAIGVGAVLAILLGFWWWPGLTGEDRQTDIGILAPVELRPAREVVERRLREEGLTTAWEEYSDTECDLGLPGFGSVEVLVIALPSLSICEDSALLDELRGIEGEFDGRPIAVVLPWWEPSIPSSFLDGLSALDLRIVDARSMIGSEGDQQECFWWDDCPAGGRIQTVVDGRLTRAGQQRLARAIVTEVL